MRSVASAPLGAPFEMSTLGAAERSLRASATPSSTQRTITGSTAAQAFHTRWSARGFVHVAPPSKDFTRK
jgi:hypothetical protein